MLGRCYKAELSKMLKSKSIYIALAIMLILIIFLGIFANMLDVDNIDEPDFTGNRIIDMLKYLDANGVPRSEYDVYIGQIEAELQSLNDNTTKLSRFYDEKGELKMCIAVLRYLQTHEEVDVANLVIPSNSLLGIAQSSYNFLWVAMTLVTQIVIFYAVVTMSNVLALEHKDGTLKMQLLRPNSRKTILTAKWLATFTMSSALLIIGIILSAIYTTIQFKFGAKDVLCIINNASVFIVDENLFAFIELLFSLVSVFAMIQFSMFMCNITKFNRSASLAVPIVVLLVGNLSALLLQVAYLGIIDFAYNLNLTSFLIPLGATLPHSSLYTAIPSLLSYLTLFMVVGYIKFQRTEL